MTDTQPISSNIVITWHVCFNRELFHFESETAISHTKLVVTTVYKFLYQLAKHVTKSDVHSSEMRFSILHQKLACSKKSTNMSTNLFANFNEVWEESPGAFSIISILPTFYIDCSQSSSGANSEPHFPMSRWMFQPLDKDMTSNDLIHFGFFASSPRFPSLDENMNRKPP
jgi:hypothetical protein